MGDEADLQLFLVEHDLRGLSPALLASAHQVLEEAVCRELGRGSRIRYVQRIFVPQEGKCLCLFQAPGPDPVRAVNDIAQFPLARILAVTSSVPHPRHTADPRRIIVMTRLDSPARTVRLAPRVMAWWGATVLLALAAPAVSLLPALTTGLRGSAPAVSFPHGYAVTLMATLAVTAAACTLGACIARRAGLIVIPIGLACWALIGLGVTAGIALGHAHLTDWGIVLLAAVAAGLGAGLPLAARR